MEEQNRSNSVHKDGTILEAEENLDSTRPVSPEKSTAVDLATSNFIINLVDQAIDSAVSTTVTNKETVPESTDDVVPLSTPPTGDTYRNTNNNNNTNNTNTNSEIISPNATCDVTDTSDVNSVDDLNDLCDDTTKLVSAAAPSPVASVNNNLTKQTDDIDSRTTTTATPTKSNNETNSNVKQIEAVIELTDQPLTESSSSSSSSLSSSETRPQMVATNDLNPSTSFTYVNQCFELEPVPDQAIGAPSVAILPVSTISETTAATTAGAVETAGDGSTGQSRARPMLPSINIMDEYGQHTETISIDGNNNNDDELMNEIKTSEEPCSPGSPPTDEELNAAVWVKNVSFSYTKKVEILSRISLTVPKGKIYALLGSSGCGKTTLLRLILGRIQQRRGDIRVFGAKPGGIHSNIPGSGVGYMPQDLALLPTFTIEETFNYFGTLHHMSKDVIRQRTEFFIEFLNLPPRDRKIGQASGGQQRRVSIAVTLFHSPPLLILDEPTVGVDPLLRCKIWQYLEQICVNNGMTVIITTHYIEESRNASNLAFMRFGRILAQESPEKLLQKYRSTVLEDVFLKLCQQDCGEIKQKYSIKNKNRKASRNPFGADPDDDNLKQIEPVRSKFHTLSVDSRRMSALFYKNLLTLKRNPLIMMFYVILPIIQISLFCYSVVKEPDHIPISVYNGENKGFSKRYLNMLDTKTLKIKYYNTPEDAIQAVVDGKSWAAISMMSNFTKAYRRRAKNPSDLDDDDFESSKIKLYMDTSDNFLHMSVYQSLLNSYKDFVESVAESFGFNRASVQLPIDLKELIYGHYNPKHGYDLINNLGPNCMVAIIYTTPLILGAFLIVLERKGGIIERTMVSGATSIEIILSHMICMMIVLVLQVILLMAVSFMVFEIRIEDGSLIELFIFFYLQGMCGIFLGLSLSSIAKNETVALVSSFALIFPVWMVSGVFWPLESIPTLLQDIFWTMPLSMPIRCINNIIKRSWSYENGFIQVGYYVSLFYNTIFFLMGIIIFHLTAK